MSAGRIRVEAGEERTQIDIGPMRSLEVWVHAIASTATLIGIAVIAQPLVTLPLRTGETILRGGLGVLFVVCVLRLLHRGVWSLGGRERYEVTPFELTVRTTCFGVGRARSYPVRHVNNVRPLDRVAPSRRGKRRVLARTIAFDVEGRTVSAAMNLSVSEASLVAAALDDALEARRREAARTYRT